MDVLWEDVYGKTPLEEIPWRTSPSGWFKELIESEAIKKGTALDLGCGTGEKTIYLAKHGFKPVGVDISETAIKHAKAFAEKENIRVEFFVDDATDLSFLGERTFDFVLDFANLHGITEEKRAKYVSGIKHYTKQGGNFFLRCFSKRAPKRSADYFFDQRVGDLKIWYFSEDDIVNLFGDSFEIIRKHRADYKRPVNDVYFDEYLMKRS